MTIQDDIYAIIVKHFGEPQHVRWKKDAGISRKILLSHMDAALVKWSLEMRPGNQSKAADLIKLNRNTVRKILTKYGKPKNAVDSFMDGLKVE